MNYVILFDLVSRLLLWWKVYSTEGKKEDPNSEHTLLICDFNAKQKQR